MKTPAKLVACGIALSLACGATAVHAQTSSQNGALSIFVNNAATDATGLQQQAAFAVQGMCTQLGLEGGLSRLTGSKRDLFERCNEMVETARVFEGIQAGTGRTLGYTDRADLLAATS